jgi:hypothetical protein
MNRMDRRKDNKSCSNLVPALFAILALGIFCSNPFEAPSSPPLLPGMGSALISLGTGSVRTLMPEAPSFAKYAGSI